jgi:hypothetical protein
MHDKPRIEIIVTGGNVRMGVYVTVVATFASDLDANLKLHAQDADIAKDKGLVVSGYDATLDKFFFLPIDNGALKVSGVLTTIAGGKTSPKSEVVTLALANTEYSHTFLTNTKEFTIRNTSKNTVTFSYQVGESLTQSFPVTPGGVYTERDIIASSVTIYFQSPKPNATISIVEWT